MSNLWFLSAVWLFFYRLFVTDQQVGLLDAMAFAIGLIAEVPSGALADRYGRDKIVKAGHMLAGFGILLQSAGSSFAPFFVGQAILMIGVSFVSGADDALFYDAINFDRTSKRWRSLVTRGSLYSLLGALCATVVGGFAYTINPRLPWVLTGFAMLLSAGVLWPLRDVRTRKKSLAFWGELRSYAADIHTGFSAFRKPDLKYYVPLIVAVQGLFYAYGFGLLRPVLLGRFGFSPFRGSIAVAVSSLITAVLLHYLHKNGNRFHEKRVFSALATTTFFGLLLATRHIGAWGFVVIFAFYAGEHIFYPFMSDAINSKADEHQRATVLSVAAFFKSLPYVVLAPLIGYLNSRGKLSYFLVVWACFVALAFVVYWKYVRGNQVVVKVADLVE